MANEESKRDAHIGTTIVDRYVIEDVLGRGGMGAVYRALQRPIDRPVAIKLIAVGVAGDSRQIVQRFQREATALAKLKHPNTVRLIEFGVTADNAMFLAMELLEGVDLGQHLGAHGAMPVAVALNIVKESLGSLAEAHALGILHRDIKPANIFLSHTHDGQVFAKLMDFGIAHLLDNDKNKADATRLTIAGSVVGTPAYMSPEQAMGNELDARSDLYSLGVTLFHMLTGRTPFEADSMASQLVAHVTQSPPRLSEVCPERGFSQQLQDLLDALLSKEPARRPASAKDTLRSVEELLRVESNIRRGNTTERWAAAGGAAASPSTPQPVAIPRTVSTTQGSGRSGSKRSITPWLLAAATSFASIGVTYVLTKSGDASTKTWVVAPASQKPAEVPPVAAPAQPLAPPVQPPAAPVAPVGEPAPEVRQEVPATPTTTEPAKPPPPKPQPAKPQLKPATPPPSQYAAAPSPPALAPAPVAIAQPQPAPPKPQPTAAVSAYQRLVAMPRADRKQYMLANWPPPYSNVTSVKTAYKSGMIDETFYDDIVWALKMRRKSLIQTEKNNYDRGLITKQEYKQRLTTIDHYYEGR